MAAICTNRHELHCRTTSVDAINIFYREAGDRDAPTLQLLHGFPTSSHMFRDLIPLAAGRYHLVAPDLPGFGFSEAPDRAQFKYSFDHLAQVIGRFTEIIGLRRYVLYAFDYGAPVGFRFALARPEQSHSHNLAERQCLRAGAEPGLEPQPKTLGGADRSRDKTRC